MGTAVQTVHAPKAVGAYSQAIRAHGLLFCSGQVGRDPHQDGQPLAAGGAAAQARQALENLKAVLEAAGTDMQSVVKTTIFLMNMADFPAVNNVYAEYFQEQKPARSTVAVAALPKGDLSESPVVEIEAIAVLPEE